MRAQTIPTSHFFNLEAWSTSFSQPKFGVPTLVGFILKRPLPTKVGTPNNSTWLA